MVKHTIDPVFDENSEILILGSFPSVKSREQSFFYGHPQNRFWKVLSGLENEDIPVTIEDKKKLLLTHHIALWDVIASCDIVGSSDSSIRNVAANDLSVILNKTNIRQIYCNGTKSFDLYNQYIKDKINREAIRLPSTSPANASFSLEKLLEHWKVILK